jgi:hypothetical protein
MSCPRGHASPDKHTKLWLFAASGGYCQHPACNRELTGSRRIHIAEMAHVFAALDDGPRPNKEMSEEERGSFENLILLCSACHTIIDKAEEDFPDKLIAGWKREHSARLAQLFGAVQYWSRAEVHTAISPLLAQNRAIFDEYNPGLDYRHDPESEKAQTWQRHMRERIIPNNRRILATLDANRAHMLGSEPHTLELFRQHIHDLEARHLTDVVTGDQRRLPAEMSEMMAARSHG